MRNEQRRYQRITPADPIKARVSGLEAYIVNLSLSGVRIAHRDPPMEIGVISTVEFEGVSSHIVMECEVVWSALHRERKQRDLRDIYHSGARIMGADPRSGQALRETIEHFIELALDEQKANARGLPPIAVRAFKTGGGTEFLRFELVKGEWLRTKTADPTQPPIGFTVSTNTSEDDIDLLCSTYARSEAEGRHLIRAMAEISISKAEGIPTRRFMP